MRKPEINSPANPIQISAIPSDFIVWTVGSYISSGGTFLSVQSHSFLEALKPFSKFAFTDTPLAAAFESRYLFALDHTHRGSLGLSQHGSDFFEGQQMQRGNVVFHWANRLSNANAIAPLSVAARFLGKAGVC
jgi:hypothetical protein